MFGGNVIVCGVNGLVSREGASSTPTSNSYIPLFTIPGTTGQVCVDWAPDGLSWVHVGSAGFTRSTSTSPPATFTTKPAPGLLIGVVHCGSIVYVCSADSVWTTTDLGTTWVL